MSQYVRSTNDLKPLKLEGIDGSNPAGFLATLGVLGTICRDAANNQSQLSWHEKAGVWNPVFHSECESVAELSHLLAQVLRCPFSPDATSEVRREQRQKAFDTKRTGLKNLQAELKKKKLRGKERDAEYAISVAPVEAEVVKLRSDWLAALKACVPSSELALGKHLNAEQPELRDALRDAAEIATVDSRQTADMLASFGSDVCLKPKSDKMDPTPFCFTSGSGNQYFLDTARRLSERITAALLEKSLSTNEPAQDEKLSMRWDPNEDRRYALMWENPTANGNEALTNWPINLLAYHGLQLLPSVPTAAGLKSAGWSKHEQENFTWPIWTALLGIDCVRTIMLQNSQRLFQHQCEVAAIFQSTRLQVGNPPLHKINFSPARNVY